jgi:hypothetical protein
MKKSILILAVVVLGFNACTSNVSTKSTTDSTTVDCVVEQLRRVWFMCFLSRTFYTILNIRFSMANALIIINAPSLKH